MAFPTTYIASMGAEEQISQFLLAVFIFCLFISLAVYLLLPKKIDLAKRVFATIFILIGLFGLFAILLKTILLILSGSL